MREIGSLYSIKQFNQPRLSFVKGALLTPPSSCHTIKMAFSSQSTLLGPESLPLFKLSFCTTATLHSKMIWTHLPHRAGLFAAFDQIRKSGLGGLVSEKKVLKLIQGGDLLVCLTI